MIFSELSIALFKSIKLQLYKKLELIYIFFKSENLIQTSCDLGENRIGKKRLFTVMNSCSLILWSHVGMHGIILPVTFDPVHGSGVPDMKTICS